MISLKRASATGVTFLAIIAGSVTASAQNAVKLSLNLNKPGVTVSPRLYGLMTEEINYSYDGGLYAELIRNRTFKDNPKAPDHWSLVQDADGTATIKLDNKQAINAALTTSLRLDIEKAGKRVGVANDGFWGIPVKPETTYKGSFYAKASANSSAPLTVSIEGADGKVIYAFANVSNVTGDWKQYSFTLTTTKNIAPSTETRFVISSTTGTGTYWFNLVSLFPPTFNNRPNGNRKDIMDLMAKMQPSFLRLPGGNYLEGQMFSTRFNWKNTLGSLEKRPGHAGPWSYRSSDGMGLLEYLEWCEDLKMEPVLALFAGYTLNKDYLEAGPLLQPFVDDALEEIEYVTGDANTKWGKQRALDGHPQPFALNYVEIGNEDGFDLSGSYDGRFAQFYDAIKAKYPQLKQIATAGGKDPLGARVPVTMRRPDAFDEHYYRSASEMERDANHYDDYDRNGPKIFVGEWATREGFPTTNFNAALGDAAWMTGMERNSDVVVMSCYAPLFVNVNPGGMQWKSDLIGYDALKSYGSPAYYAQVMFNAYKGDQVVNTTGENVPTQLEKISSKDSIAGIKPKTIPAMFYVATRDSKSGTVYLKVVNAANTSQNIQISLTGAGKVQPTGKMVVLKADKPEDTNTITDPEKIVPVTSVVKGLGKTFSRSFPAYSITILQIESK